jgi:hypothetical protein
MSALHIQRHPKQEVADTIAAVLHELNWAETKGSGIRTMRRMAGETVWLKQNQMADLILTTKQSIGQHIRDVFAEGELAPEPVVKGFFTTAAAGKQYRTKHYSLGVIISVGYRVKSHRGTQFRSWATQQLPA